MSVCFFYLAQNARAEVSIIGSSGSEIKIEKIAVFDEPWALTFINENDLLVSTKKGKLWLVNEDGKKSSIDGLPDITYGGQGGLGDILPHPDFRQNNLLYISFVSSENNGRTRGAKVVRARLEHGKLLNHELIWEQLPHTRGRGHFSHRLAFGPTGSPHNGMLFISSGDRQIMDPAQSFNNNLGKIIRLQDDGRIPKDNPFASTRSSNSVKDFFPKFLNFNRSFLLYETKSPSVSTSAAFKQFKALTDKSMSTSFVFNNCLMCRDVSSNSSVSDFISLSSVILSSENNMK